MMNESVRQESESPVSDGSNNGSKRTEKNMRKKKIRKNVGVSWGETSTSVSIPRRESYTTKERAILWYDRTELKEIRARAIETVNKRICSKDLTTKEDQNDGGSDSLRGLERFHTHHLHRRQCDSCRSTANKKALIQAVLDEQKSEYTSVETIRKASSSLSQSSRRQARYQAQDDTSQAHPHLSSSFYSSSKSSVALLSSPSSWLNCNQKRRRSSTGSTSKSNTTNTTATTSNVSFKPRWKSIRRNSLRQSYSDQSDEDDDYYQKDTHERRYCFTGEDGPKLYNVDADWDDFLQ